MSEPGPRFLLKDLFNRQSVGAIANSIQAVMPAFDGELLHPECSTPAGPPGSSSSGCTM